jgi:hypothetical protein
VVTIANPANSAASCEAQKAAFFEYIGWRNANLDELNPKIQANLLSSLKRRAEKIRQTRTMAQDVTRLIGIPIRTNGKEEHRDRSGRETSEAKHHRRCGFSRSSDRRGHY